MSAVKKRQVELVFKQLDMAADGGRGDMQFFRGQLDAEKSTRGFEGSQSVEGRERSHGEILPRAH